MAYIMVSSFFIIIICGTKYPFVIKTDTLYANTVSIFIERDIGLFYLFYIQKPSWFFFILFVMVACVIIRL
jgi:hypothetical protein